MTGLGWSAAVAVEGTEGEEDAATTGGRSWRRRRCDELCWRETVLLHGEWSVSVFGGEDGLFELRSEEGAGSPLSSSLVPATEREKKLLWFKGHRKMRAELGRLLCRRLMWVWPWLCCCLLAEEGNGGTDWKMKGNGAPVGVVQRL
ncbi:hypothetical protein BDE02_15G032100 [Populus trichocarpa]|nr:hypothetical protein BDE02_15G032100 [Populus trichocarpa]